MRFKTIQVVTIVAFSVVLALSVVNGTVAAMPASESASRDAIIKVIDMQKNAWNSGDLDTFLTGYYESPDTSYTSGGQEYWGYEALRQKYTKSYGTSRDTMGTLEFSELKVIDVGADSAYCVGHWHLERKEKQPLEGVFTLVLKNTSAGWKIIHDHTTSTR